MSRIQIDIPKQRIEAFCRKHHIRKLALFGSVLREDFRPDSDVDVLVEFDPDHVPGLRFIDIRDELSEILGGVEVDLITPAFLRERIRQDVMDEAEPLYAARRSASHRRHSASRA